MTIAYLTSWFPAYTETFILNEILGLQRLGLHVDVFPLFGAQTPVLHPQMLQLEGETVHTPAFSHELLAAHRYWLRNRKAAYRDTLDEVVCEHSRSPGALARALFVFAKAALLAKVIEARRCLHVHAHWATHPALSAYVIHRLTGVSYSFTAHAHDLYLHDEMLRRKAERASFVVTISEFNRRLLVERSEGAAAGKTTLIRCGVDVQRFHPALRRPSTVFTVACVGALRDYKGHRHLIDACAVLRDEGRRFRCLLVGDGPERKQLTHRVRTLRLDDVIEFRGALAHDRVLAVLNECDAAVQPSIVTAAGMMEGIPVSLMEAMACGLAVVSTTTSGIGELVESGTTGLLVPPGDATALARALDTLIDDPSLRERLGRAGRGRVEADFSLSVNVARLASQILSEVRSHTSRPMTLASPAA